MLTIVTTGSKHFKHQALKIILPKVGSMGIFNKWDPKTVTSSFESKASISFSILMAELITIGLGASGTLEIKSLILTLSSANSLACRHNSNRGVLRISGVEFKGKFSNLALEYRRKTVPGAVRPALPFLWVAEFCDTHVALRAVEPDRESKDFSLTFPLSMTILTSSKVNEVSAEMEQKIYSINFF